MSKGHHSLSVLRERQVRTVLSTSLTVPVFGRSTPTMVHVNAIYVRLESAQMSQRYQISLVQRQVNEGVAAVRTRLMETQQWESCCEQRLSVSK